jgi:hypothetical protein
MRAICSIEHAVTISRTIFITLIFEFRLAVSNTRNIDRDEENGVLETEAPC